MMQNKFLNLIESAISRHSNGNLLIGDIVKVVKNYKSKDSYKKLSDGIKDYLEDFLKTDKSLRVVDIKTEMPSRAPGDEANRGSSFNVELATEFAPGSYDLQRKVTVPSDILEPANVYPNLTPIPDSIRKKERRNFTPVEVDVDGKPGNSGKEEDEETQVNNPYLQTMMSQDGNKLVRGDRSKGQKNIKIPSVSVKTPMVVKGFEAKM